MAVEHKHDAVTTQRVGALKTAEPLASQKAVTGNEAAPTDTIKSGKLDSAEVRDDGAGHCGRRCLLCDIARADCAPRSSARARGSECRHAARHTCDGAAAVPMRPPMPPMTACCLSWWPPCGCTVISNVARPSSCHAPV
jgi:hypothetical protein